MRPKSLNKIFGLAGQQVLLKTKKYIEAAGEVADVVIRLRDKPTPSDYIAIGLRVVSSFSDALAEDPWDFFSRDWVSLDEWGFGKDLIEVCSKYNSEKFLSNGRGSYSLYQASLPGLEKEETVGWSKENDYIRGPYIHTNRYDQTLISIGRAVWASLGNCAIEIVSSKYGSKEDDAECKLREDESRKEKVYGSQLANDILNRIELFEKKGFNRSIMLVGIPGTGKTTLMKYIAQKMNLLSLRVSVNELDAIDPKDVIRAVELLKPNLLMIDDFDRFDRAHSMLSELEQVNKSVKIFMVTCNSTDQLDEAILRPGRFDEIVEVSELDPNIVEKLLGNDVEPKLKEILQSWPVAFIAEFHKRRQVLGDAGAIEELDEFQSRINKILTKDFYNDILEEEESAITPNSFDLILPKNVSKETRIKFLQQYIQQQKKKR